MVELSKTDKKQLDASYNFGSKVFWECLEQTKNENLDSESVGMEILYQVVHFLESKGWLEDDIVNFITKSFKDATDNKLYQNELSKIKVKHRGAGKLTDKERGILIKEKKILKEGDYADLVKENDSVDIAKDNKTIDIPSELHSEELASA